MRRALLAIGALIPLIAACGGVDQEPSLAGAVARTEAVGSARVEFRLLGLKEGQEDIVCGGFADYARDRSLVTCEDLNLSQMWLGNVVYKRFGGHGKSWTSYAPAGHPLHALSPKERLAMLLASSRESERLGDEEVRGDATVRYRLTVDRDKADLYGQGETTVDVWVDGDGLIRRIRADEAGVTWTMEFFDFGVAVAIELPPANQVEQIDVGLCLGGEAKPISEGQAIETLRRHGFAMRSDGSSCDYWVSAPLRNTPAEGDTGAVLECEGIVFCHVLVKPPPDATEIVVRREADGADAELSLENLDCTILADSPNAEEKIDPLEEAFDELQRAIRP